MLRVTLDDRFRGKQTVVGTRIRKLNVAYINRRSTVERNCLVLLAHSNNMLSGGLALSLLEILNKLVAKLVAASAVPPLLDARLP